MNFEELFKKLNEDLGREMGHMNFYLAAASLVRGLHREEISEFFLEAAQSEMQHVKQFQDLLIGLSARRGLNLVISWDAVDFTKSQNPEWLLNTALKMEDEVVENYVKRIEEAVELQENGDTDDKVDGKWIELFLESQIEDSRQDADNIRQMVKFADF